MWSGLSQWASGVSLSERRVEKGLEEGYVPKVESLERWGIKEGKDISHWFFTIYSIIFFIFFGYFSIYSGSPTGQLIFVWSINYVWTRVPLFCSERSMLVFTIYVPKLSFSVCLSLSQQLPFSMDGGWLSVLVCSPFSKDVLGCRKWLHKRVMFLCYYFYFYFFF